LSAAILLGVSFAVALVVATGLVPLVRRVAIDRSLLDEPGGRKVHLAAVPRLGGIAMLIAFLVGLLVVLLLARLSATQLDLTGVPVLLLAVMAFSALGLFDDLKPLPPAVKLAGQVVIAVVVVALGLHVEELSTRWGRIDPGIWGAALSVAWLVAIANATNLLDGLDGLAAAVSVTAMVAFVAICLVIGANGLLPVVAAGAGAAIGFLIYNRPPASIIMGDTGSMFLGSLLAGIAILLVAASPSRVSPLSSVLVLAVPIADTIYAVIRRMLARQSIFAADDRHIHHQLVASGMPPAIVVLLLVAVSVVCSVIGVLLTR
jgi:UDP-GlcNAc:undecaprenyl-phosphate/decaprenyl-phosphate GlcNAc-1-phosphate transferase